MPSMLVLAPYPASRDVSQPAKAVNACRYTFEYPASWKNDVVNKVCHAHHYLKGEGLDQISRHVLKDRIECLQTEKGMQGIDSRVINPKIGKSKQMSCPPLLLSLARSLVNLV